MKSGCFIFSTKIMASVLTVALCIPVCAQKPKPHTTAPAVDHAGLGLRLARERRWVEAEREFRIAHQQHPDSVEAAVGHAEALVQISQPFDAALELQSFLKDHPKALRAHEFYAVVAIGAIGDFVIAESELEKCVQLAPNSGLDWKSLGDVYLGRTRPADAVEAYKKASQLLPHDAVVVASMADGYSQAQEPDKAATAFARAIKMAESAPSSPQARRDLAGVQYLYGKYLLSQGRAKDSVAATTKALQFIPRSPVALYSRAKAYEALGDYQHAEADALLAFEVTPHDKQGPLLLIDIYRKQHDMEKAQKYSEVAQKLVDEEQDRASFAREVRRLLGVAEHALGQGQFSEAIPPYEDLIKKVPTFYEAYFGVGMCYSQTGRLADAEAAFRKYLSFQPVSGDGHAALGVLLQQLGRGEESVPELQRALQIDPSLDEVRKALASEYLRESKPEESLRVLRAAKDTKDTQLIVMLANLLLRQDDKAGAEREVSRALAIQPDDEDALRLKQEILATRSKANR
jgi:tetratricopeptide (TPR) repeat protein